MSSPKSNSSKPLIVNGVQYASLNQASISTGFDRKTIRAQIAIQGGSIKISHDRKPPNYWTLERVQEIAKTCATRMEFWEKHKGAALRAQRSGWLDSLYGHMDFVKHDKGFWQTYENVKQVADLCETRAEFQSSYPAAYASATENAWLAKVCKHMVVRKSSGEVLVRKFLLSHDIRSIPQMKFEDCKDKRPLPFDEFLPDFGILIEIQGTQHKVGWGQTSESLTYIAHHDKIKKEYAIKNGYKFIELWDFSEKAIYSTLKTELEASIKELNLDYVLKNRNLTDEEAFDLKTYGQWTFEKVKEAANKCGSPRDFQKRYSVAYSKAHKMGWSDELFGHMTRTLRKHGHWTHEKISEAAQTCKTKSEFQKKFVGAYNVAIKEGILESVCGHMTQLRVPTWTLASIKEAAKSCSTYSEFKLKHHSAYAVARKNKWLDEVRSHMSPGQLPHGYWNDFDRVMEVAQQCKSRTEFQLRYGSARNAAKKYGWMDLVCAHMK